MTSISGLREINPINKFPKITKLSRDLLDGKSWGPFEKNKMSKKIFKLKSKIMI